MNYRKRIVWIALLAVVGLAIAGTASSSNASVIDDPRGDWTSPGPDHTDILRAGLAQTGGSFVFSMVLAGAVPSAPERYASYDFPLDFGAGLGSVWVGCGCTDCANGVWNPAIGRWNEDGTGYTLTALPEDAFVIANDTITLTVPMSQLQAPGAFQWAAGTHFDNDGIDVRDITQTGRWSGRQDEPIARLRLVEITHSSSVLITVKNIGQKACMGVPTVRVGLAYARSWIPETQTQFLSRSFDPVVIQPRQTATFVLDLPGIPESALEVLQRRLTKVWTGYTDPEPGTDYVGFILTVGEAKAVVGFLPIREF